ncbi:NADH-quinone oxidoreductase subunit J [Bounagaea algeriensis]
MDVAGTISPPAHVLAQAASPVGTGEAVVFWIIGPLALLGALGMVFASNAVHSALWLAMTMLGLGVLYMAQSAQFLGFTQIIVYTGAIMMLFLFVLMMVGRDSSDSVVEVLRGQRVWAGLGGIALATLLATGLARSVSDVPVAAPLNPWDPAGGGAGGLGRVVFTDYLLPFELTSALLITAAVGAMVLAYGGKGRRPRTSQKHWVHQRLRGERPSPLPGPGVYATANSVATPALLPDGSVAPDSLSEILESVPAEDLLAERDTVAGSGAEPSPHALTGEQTDAATTQEPGEAGQPRWHGGENNGGENNGGENGGEHGGSSADDGQHAAGGATPSGHAGGSGSADDPVDPDSGPVSSEEVRQ